MSTQRPYTKFAVAGGTGNVGKHIVRALSSKGFSVFVLTRQGTNNFADDPNIKTVQIASYKDEDVLTDALQGVQVVINALSMNTLNSETQLPLAEASVRAGVQLFVPNEFGPDYDFVQSRNDPPLHAFSAAKIAFRSTLTELGLNWLVIYNGIFGTYFPWLALELDKENKRVRVAGRSEQPLAVTDEEDIGAFVAAAFDKLNKDQLVNTTLRVVGKRISLTQAFQQAGYTVEHVEDLAPIKARAQQPPGPQSILAWLQLMTDSGSGDILQTDNDKVGLTKLVTDPVARVRNL